MERTNNNRQSGGSKLYYVVVGILVAVGLYFAVKSFQDRNGDITVHLPRIEVH